MASVTISEDALFRIKVTLSSRKTAVETFRVAAHSYSLEGTEWQSIASGVPCIIKVLESTEENSPFSLKYVLADAESGLTVWEEQVTSDANYYGYQGTFHTFKGKSGKRFGIHLSDEKVAVDILERMYDLSLELAKHEAGDGTTSAENEVNAKASKRRIRRINTLSKKDISLPCNFVHISGVSKEKTTDNGEHLSSLLERKMKSLSAIVLPSYGRRNKKSPPTKYRSSTDVSHERIFAKAMATPSQQSTPELVGDKSSNVVQRNTWNFGMLRKHSNGAIKAEKPRKGLFRRNSFSGISPFNLNTAEDVDISGPVLISKPAALDHQRSPDAVKPCSPDQPSFACEPVRQRYTPSPPHTTATVNENATAGYNPHYNTLPSNLRRSHSVAASNRYYMPRNSRERSNTNELSPRTDSMTLTRYSTEPTSIYPVNSQPNIPRSEFPQSEFPQTCGSTSDLVLRKPARSQYSHMKEDEITAAAAATIARYTERMAKALQQFDDVLLQHDSSPTTPHSSAVVC